MYQALRYRDCTGVEVRHAHSGRFRPAMPLQIPPSMGGRVKPPEGRFLRLVVEVSLDIENDEGDGPMNQLIRAASILQLEPGGIEPPPG